jgi:hypothetical protein
MWYLLTSIKFYAYAIGGLHLIGLFILFPTQILFVLLTLLASAVCIGVGFAHHEYKELEDYYCNNDHFRFIESNMRITCPERYYV